MTPWVLGLIALVAIALVGFRSNHRLVKLFAGTAAIGLLVALGTWFVSEYQWANTTDCREAFPEQFGYRPPDWEIPPPGELEDVRVWWPIGHQCQGTDVDTGEHVVGKPGWGPSLVIYPALGIIPRATSPTPPHRYARSVSMASVPDGTHPS
ncbi:hypothetical protein M1C57_20810 [Rhodococcus pyridinivorans]|uniref:hypothetical protein n=1 Tax=Rhodococcus pyridinivorans TaxID=103816 RepID=UPI002009F5CB|nr:hypothetical protein [Rhodococcus pyridinivorans]UPW04033.1 hypothetical protein M1C57_20810 [Rhodococcus pyridinivorans]